MSEFKVYYHIEDGLALTDIRSADRHSIVKHINDEDIHNNTLQIPYPYFIKDADEFIALCRAFEEQYDEVGQYAIRWQGEMIGGIGFMYTYGPDSHIAEIGYWIGATFRKRGFATKAILKIVEIGQEEKKLLRLEANVFVDNFYSMKALENANFEKEGLRKGRFVKNGKLKDAILYAYVAQIE